MSGKSEKIRPGIDDEPSAQTIAICGEHKQLICDLAKAIGVPRATILRSINHAWVMSDEGAAARRVVAQWRAGITDGLGVSLRTETEIALDAGEDSGVDPPTEEQQRLAAYPASPAGYDMITDRFDGVAAKQHAENAALANGLTLERAASIAAVKEERRAAKRTASESRAMQAKGRKRFR